MTNRRMTGRSGCFSHAFNCPENVRASESAGETPAPGFEAVLVRVELPVGAREGRHTHPGLLLINVEEGTLTLDYEGKPSTDYKPRGSVVVESGKVHEAINMGNTPIKAIATFVIPKGATLTTQVK